MRLWHSKTWKRAEQKPASASADRRPSCVTGHLDALHREIIDNAVAAYVEWREECARVWDAYEGWARTCSEETARAYAAYRAALDREEAAAKVYALLMEPVADIFSTAPR